MGKFSYIRHYPRDYRSDWHHKLLAKGERLVFLKESREYPDVETCGGRCWYCARQRLRTVLQELCCPNRYGLHCHFQERLLLRVFLKVLVDWYQVHQRQYWCFFKLSEGLHIHEYIVLFSERDFLKKVGDIS